MLVIVYPWINIQLPARSSTIVLNLVPFPSRSHDTLETWLALASPTLVLNNVPSCLLALLLTSIIRNNKSNLKSIAKLHALYISTVFFSSMTWYIFPSQSHRTACSPVGARARVFLNGVHKARLSTEFSSRGEVELLLQDEVDRWTWWRCWQRRWAWILLFPLWSGVDLLHLQ